MRKWTFNEGTRIELWHLGRTLGTVVDSLRIELSFVPFQCPLYNNSAMPRVSKSKSKLKGKAAPSKKKSAFILTGEHKLFLTKRADEHAEASQQEKLKIVALAIQELLAEYSITCKEDIRKADKVYLTCRR